MKLSVERSRFSAALSSLARIVDDRSMVPIATNVLFATLDGALRLTATDLDIVAAVEIPADVTDAGSLALPLSILEGWVGRLPAGSSIEFDGDDRQVKAKSGRSRISLDALPAKDFPPVFSSEPEGAHQFDISGTELSALIGGSEFAISKGDPARFFLTGLYLHVHSENGVDVLCAAGADGMKVGVATCSIPRGAEGIPGSIIPKKAVLEIARMAASAGEDAIAMVVGKGRVEAKVGGAVLKSKLIDSHYAEFRRILPEVERSFVMDAGDLRSAIARVSSVCMESGRGIFLSLSEGSIRLHMKGIGGNETEEELPCDYDAEELTFAVGARHANEILKTLDCDTVEFAMGPPGRPIVIRPTADTSRFCVLMPMRTA